MKTLTLAACAAAALSLAACATTSLEAKSANAQGGVEAYKIFADTCDRHYGWPFTLVIDCTARDKLAAQADQIRKMVSDAVAVGIAEAVKEIKAAVAAAPPPAAGDKPPA